MGLIDDIKDEASRVGRRVEKQVKRSTRDFEKIVTLPIRTTRDVLFGKQGGGGSRVSSGTTEGGAVPRNFNLDVDPFQATPFDFSNIKRFTPRANQATRDVQAAAGELVTDRDSVFSRALRGDTQRQFETDVVRTARRNFETQIAPSISEQFTTGARGGGAAFSGAARNAQIEARQLVEDKIVDLRFQEFNNEFQRSLQAASLLPALKNVVDDRPYELQGTQLALQQWAQQNQFDMQEVNSALQIAGLDLQAELGFAGLDLQAELGRGNLALQRESLDFNRQQAERQQESGLFGSIAGFAGGIIGLATGIPGGGVIGSTFGQQAGTVAGGGQADFSASFGGLFQFQQEQQLAALRRQQAPRQTVLQGASPFSPSLNFNPNANQIGGFFNQFNQFEQ